MRPAEISDDTIAEKIRDIAAVSDHGAAHRILVAADQLAQILRIEATRQFGRTDQIAEQHRQLAPLGVAARGVRSSTEDTFARPLDDCAQQPAAVAER